MARRFDGTSGYVTNNDAAGVLGGLSVHTLSFWALVDVSVASAYILGHNAGSDRPMAFGHWSDGHYFFGHYSFGSWKVCMDPNNPPLGRWHHMLGTYDSGTGLKELWREGVKIDSQTLGSWLTSGSTFQIGRAPGGAPYFDGKLRECAVWNQVLTPGEIARLSKGVSPGSIRRGALRGYWPMDDAEGRARDLSPYGQHMTESGGTTGEPSDINNVTYIGGLVDVPVVSSPVDTGTVLVDLQASGTEIGSIGDVGEAYVDIQPGGTDGYQFVDASTVRIDIEAESCEWFTPLPESIFDWVDTQLWFCTGKPKWGANAAGKWTYDVQPVSTETIEICT